VEDRALVDARVLLASNLMASAARGYMAIIDAGLSMVATVTRPTLEGAWARCRSAAADLTL
jgi:hypothetical protein